MVPNGYLGMANDILIENNTIYGVPSLEPYRSCMNCLYNDSTGGINIRGDSISVVNNYIYNIKRGVSGSASNQYIAHNWINYLIGDGFRITSNNSFN